MAIFQTLITLVIKRAGRVMNTLFGWATTMLFGKVPEQRQMYLSVIAFGSVLWLVVVLGIAFPSVATFLLAFVTLPDWLKPWMRWIMLGAAIVIPPIVGAFSLFLVDPEDRPNGAAAITKEIFRGYLYTVGLAVTLVMMLVIAPIIKIQNIGRRWKSNHVPVVVEATDYQDVVRDVQRVLWAGGLQTERRPASALLRWPTKVFAWFVGGKIEDLVADELTSLKAPDFEVIIHPSDLLLRGREDQMRRAFALITESLTFTKSYMTWTKEAREFEDRFERLLQDADEHERITPLMLDRLHEIEEDLKEVKVSEKEWEVLLRIKLQAELTLLRRLAGLEPSSRHQSLAERESAIALNINQPPQHPTKTKKPRTAPTFVVNATAAVLAIVTWVRRGPRGTTPQ